MWSDIWIPAFAGMTIRRGFIGCVGVLFAQGGWQVEIATSAKRLLAMTKRGQRVCGYLDSRVRGNDNGVACGDK